MPNFNDTQNAFVYKTKAELKKAYWLFKIMANPTLTKLGAWFTPKFLWFPGVKTLIKNTIYKQFCGGVNLEEACLTAEKMNFFNIGAILDYGVEGKSSEEEFEKAKQAFVDTILFANKKEYIPFVSVKLTAFFRFELLEKMHDGEHLNAQEMEEKNRAIARLDKICEAGFKNNTMILIDAEESWIQNPVDYLALEMMKKYNKNQMVVYNTYQMYRHDRLEVLQNDILQLNNDYILGVKLVRGAYMEKERKRAQEKNYASPIQPNKEATDNDFDAAVILCLNNLDKLHLFIGTHNENSCFKACEYMRQNNISPNSAKVYFSQLFGMSDNISFNLSNEKYCVAKYLPYGPVTDVIPYLIRRANENTSVAGQTGRELDLIKKELQRRKTEACN